MAPANQEQGCDRDGYYRVRRGSRRLRQRWHTTTGSSACPQGVWVRRELSPRARLSRKAIYDANAWFAPNLKGKARGHRTLGNWDEDVITLAVAAARDCLGTHEDRSHVEAV